MSPFYSYRHAGDEKGACPAGAEFEWDQPAADLPLARCPHCGGRVEKLLTAPGYRPRKFNCELKDMGFTKLVRVDEGVFENVTRRPGEARYVDRRRPETLPHLGKTIKD